MLRSAQIRAFAIASSTFFNLPPLTAAWFSPSAFLNYLVSFSRFLLVIIYTCTLPPIFLDEAFSGNLRSRESIMNVAQPLKASSYPQLTAAVSPPANRGLWRMFRCCNRWTPHRLWSSSRFWSTGSGVRRSWRCAT
eukprot:905103-Pleurochrysis_carterae.AAC.1